MINYELIENLRKKHRWSYKTLAKKLACPVDIIKLWGTGELSPRKEELIKLAKLYDIPVEDLIIPEKRESKISLIGILILLIVGLMIGLLFDNYIYMFILPILNITIYLCFYNLLKYKSVSNDVPKSLFGFNITCNEKKIYFYEANIIASIYTYLAILLRFLNIAIFIPHINIIGEKKCKYSFNNGDIIFTLNDFILYN